MERRGNGRWVWREEGFKTPTEERFREGLGSERDVVPKGINIFSKSSVNLKKKKKKKGFSLWKKGVEIEKARR